MLADVILKTKAMTNQPNNKIIIGRIGSSYGVRGWAKINSFTNPIDNILSYMPWQIKHGKHWISVTITESKTHGKGLIVKLPMCDNCEQVREYTNNTIAIEREQLPDLQNEEYYHRDLIGLNVHTVDGIDLGQITDIQATGSNDVLIVKGDKERLLPYTDDTVKSIDLDKQLMIVDWDPEF